MRRTKIIATLGPATTTLESIESIVAAGVDVVRINMSHGSYDSHRERVRHVREAADRVGRPVGILGDLQGPKIRIAQFKAGTVKLSQGQAFCLDGDCPLDAGDTTRVGYVYENLPNDVKSGDTLILDDGRINLIVKQVDGKKIFTEVTIAGPLSGAKGINKAGGGLTAPSLTEKDEDDIRFLAELDVEYIAVSFPRSGEDMRRAKQLIADAGADSGVIAKIERAEALDNLEDIIAESDVIMIARGDLGVEIGYAELPAVQKRIMRAAREADTVVITATEMMQSMVENMIPTRAEVLDVANAVIDGTDAVMLSQETAVGQHPAEVIRAMARICVGAESYSEPEPLRERRKRRYTRVDEAIAKASIDTANLMDIKAIAALTETGSTPLWMSRISSAIPIFAMTRHEKTRRRVTLYRGVYPVNFNPTEPSSVVANREATEELVRRGVVTTGDLIIITKGDLIGKRGGTDGMKIVTVGNEHHPGGD